MKSLMAGVTVSFVAEPELAARAAASCVLLSAAARRNLRFAWEQGGAEAPRELAAALSRTVTQVANSVLKWQLLEHARASEREPATEAEILDEASDPVRRNLCRRGEGGRREIALR
jgi:hypothetical protein